MVAIENLAAEDNVVLRGRRGIVVRAWDGASVVVQWDDEPVGSEALLSEADAEAIETEYRYAPPGWDRIRREYKPGVDLQHRRALRALKAFGL